MEEPKDETVSLGLKKRNKKQRNDAVSLNKNERKLTKRCPIDSTRVIIDRNGFFCNRCVR